MPEGKLRPVLRLLLAALLCGCGQVAVGPRDEEPATISRGQPSPAKVVTTSFPGTTFPPRTDSSRPELPSVSSRNVRLDPAYGNTAPTGQQSSLIHVFFSQVWESVDANRSNPNNMARVCGAVVGSARRQIDVAGFEIDNEVIIEALVAAYRRGVKVRVVTDADYQDEAGPKAFASAGIPVLPDSRTALMHNKFLIIDGMRVWTGSFNFTENCAYKNNNNAVVIDDPVLAANYAEKFRWFWELRKFGGRPSATARIPQPQVRLGDGTQIEVYFSTHDDVDQRVMAAIGQARRSIRFLAFSFTHKGIADAMVRRASAGVNVAGVIESRQNSSHSEFERLRSGGVDVLLDGNSYQMHHKVIVIDDETVITGSYNFSASATQDNDENLLIIRHAGIARQFTDEFSRVQVAARKSLANSDARTRR